MTIIIYTDGACSGNPGPGGWGASLTSGEHRREIRGGELETTNNRMELLAAIKALEALKDSSTVELHTDSQYLRQGITQWIHGWKRNGWKTAAKKPVKNADLWQRLDELRKQHEVDWRWVKGHAGHPENERADELARMGLQDRVNGVESEDIVTGPDKPATPTAPFELHPQLAADTFEVAQFELCTVLLMNDRRYPWLILVPRRDGLRDLDDLSETDSRAMMDEIRQASHALKELFSPFKLNVAALGNMVPQLHVHVIARQENDPAWPGPVWGVGDAAPYQDAARKKRLTSLKKALR